MDLHTQFEALTVEQIETWISAGKEEHLTLEFKSVKSSSLRSTDDKRNLSRSISGFANSSGGLTVWGVLTERSKEKPDVASESKHIDDLKEFLSRLNSLTGEAVQPTVDGIRHRALETSANSGYAVTLVPESDSGPHMAKLGENRYFKRSGDSFYPMEHFDIQDMFGRRKRPSLTLHTHVRRSGHRTGVIIGITNEGRGTAFAPYLGFSPPKPFRLSQYGVDGNGNEGLPRLVSRGLGYRHRFGGTTAVVIHPGTTLEVASIDLGIPAPENVELPESIDIPFELTAQDMQLQEGLATVAIPKAESASA